MGGGQGTPWGPMEYGKPEDLQLQTDPYAVKGAPDLTPVRQAMLAKMASDQGSANSGALARLTGMGVGGSEAGAALGNIAGETAGKTAQAEAQLGQQDFTNRMSLMDQLNKAKLMKYQIDSGNYGNENAGRAGALGAMVQLPFEAAKTAALWK